MNLSVCPIPDKTLSFAQQHPVTLLAMCIWGEARGDSEAAKLGVGCVVRNRVNRNWAHNNTYTQVILQPYQFDCFLKSDPNASKILDPLRTESTAVWDSCYYAALRVMLPGVIQDVTNGAVFYYSSPVQAAPAAWGTVWFTGQLGDTHFYTDRQPVMIDKVAL